MKRIFSVFTLVCMLVSMLPVGVFTALAQGDLPHINNYEFNSVSVFDSNGVPPGGDVAVNVWKGYSAENWEYGAASNLKSANLRAQFVQIARNGTLGTLGALVFKIKVDQTMEYRPTLKHGVAATRAKFGTYLFSEETVSTEGWTFSSDDITEIHNDFIPLGGKIIDAGEGTGPNVVTFEDKMLSEGTYYLVFITEDGTTMPANGRAILDVYYFRLTETAKFDNAPADKTTVRYVSLAINDKKVSISGFLSDATAITAKNVSVTYDSSDEKVAVINSLGEITDIGIGTTTITANVEYAGEVTKKTIEYTVTEAPAKVTIGSATLGIKNGKAVVEGKLTNGDEITILNSKIAYASSDESVVKVNSMTGDIVDIAKGKATIQATIEYDGDETIVTAEYEVNEEPPAFDEDVPYVSSYKFNSVSVQDGNGKVPGGDVGYKDWNKYSAENWEYGSVNNLAVGTLRAQYMQIARTAGVDYGAVILKIKVNETMVYRPTIKYGKAASRAAFSAYLFSEDIVSTKGWTFDSNDIVAIHDEFVPMGATILDGYSTEGGTDVATFEDVPLAKGTYYLILIAENSKIGPLPANGRAIADIYWFKLTEAAKFDNATDEKTFISYVDFTINDKLAKVAGFLSDGSVISTTNTQISFKSSDVAVASINQTSGAIIDNGIGTTTITATVVYNGEKIEKNLAYTVSEMPVDWSGEDIVYDFTEVSSGWTADKVLEAGFSDANPTATGDLRGVTYFYSGNWEWRGTGNDKGFNTWTPPYTDVMIYTHKSLPTPHAYIIYRKNVADANSYVAFNIKVPKAGKYSAAMEYAALKSVGDADLYIMPVPENNDDIYSMCDNAHYIGNINSLDATLEGTEMRFKRLKNVEFDKPGEYVLVFKKGTIGTQVRFKKLFLDGINDLESIDVKISNNKIIYGETENITVSATRLDGTVMDPQDYKVEYATVYDHILKIDNGVVKGIGDGKETITVKVSDKTSSLSVDLPVVGNDMSGIVHEECEVVFPDVLYVRGAKNLSWKIKMKSGNVVDFPFDVPVEYTFSRDDLATIDENGKVIANSDNIEGNVTVGIETEFKGEIIRGSVTFEVKLSEGKTAPTYYTEEMRANALSNISKYAWAKSMQKEAISEAEYYLENFEAFYDNMPEGEIPRSYFPGRLNDPVYMYCRWCGADNAALHGGGTHCGLSISPVTRPWKVQCPECKRLFPSNDFELFYNRCVEKYGYFDSKLARELNDYYVSIGEKDALKNELYPDLTGVCKYGALREGETIEEWGVDDGWGYIPTKPDGSTYCAKQFDHTHDCSANDPQNPCIEENHAYIASYMFSFWGEYVTALKSLAKAYVYTGDIKYGRAGAILVDRLADVAPTYDLTLKQINYPTGGGSYGMGHVIGTVPDASWSVEYLRAADAFWPCLTDRQVISYLEDKSETKWKGRTDSKASALDIWNSWEKNLIEPMFGYVRSGRINGNYGMNQAVVALSALVLDKEPESSERMEWIWKKETNGYTNGNMAAFLRNPDLWNGEPGVFVTGGDLESRLVDVVDRDGFGNETSPSYNGMWFGRIFQVTDALNKFGVDGKDNLYSNPKFVAMHISFLSLIVSNYYTIQIGDIPGAATKSITSNEEALIELFKTTDKLNASEETKKDIKKKIVDFLLLIKNYDLSGVNGGIFSEDPESIREEMQEIAGDQIPCLESEMLTGYGFGILRDGALYSTSKKGENVDNQRSIYVNFGRNTGHAHADKLAIGMDAYGLNIAPDLGYGTAAGAHPERLQWTNITLSHNTVSVDRRSQMEYTRPHGDPLHFDDSENVQLIDVSNTLAYNQVDEYRRTVVMVKVDDSVSYGIDFFRILGGSVHTYSFHSQAENAYAVAGLDSMQKQVDEDGNYVGSYAANFGASLDYPTGKDPNSPNTTRYETVYPRGYTWLDHVRRDIEPEQKFSVEFDVEDYRGVTDGGDDIVLRLTQLNDFTPSEVSIVRGPVPERGENVSFPRYLDFMLVHHEAEGEEKLDSLFATVLEPYKEGRRYLKDMNPCSIEILSGKEDETDKAYAVRVEHESGRVDYIVYATNNSVTYRVDDLFDFKGFVGVYSLNDRGENIYRYVHDGNVIGDVNESEENTNIIGTVAGYPETILFDNYIDVDFGELSLSDDEVNKVFANKYIYIDNDEVENGVYKIVSAKNTDDGNVRLDTGLVSPIRAHIDPADPSKGYVFNVRKGQTAIVYSSFEDANLPEFEKLGENLSATAGSSIKLDINAKSPIETDIPKAITFIGTVLPRGANLNSETGEITWKPSASQVGENHFAITARDADGRESTLRFVVTVYGSTTNNKQDTPSTSTTPEVPTTPSASGGGTGSSGGGGGISPVEPSKPEIPTESIVPEVPSDEARFIDLGKHSWAESAINALADEGIIKGTSENTFSPANNITRADFTLLLVRAFKLESDNIENFADVVDSDYFAAELAIARNTGIVSGIGDNKYAPRNNITRQDMMLIVYRALAKLNVEIKESDVAKADTYEDFTEISDYAKDAVITLVNAGLVNGKSGKIAPCDYTTRAEVAVLIKRILDFIK